MLTKIVATSARGATLELPLEDASNGFIVADVEGLDPVKAVIVSSSLAGIDGEQHHSSRREKRNIVLKLELDPAYKGGTVGGLRNRLLGFFMTKTEVNLQFIVDDLPLVDITGEVESFDSPRFSQKPEATISILCLEPDFVTQERVSIDSFTTDKTDEIQINYGGGLEGTVNAGIRLRMNIDRPLNGFTIFHRPPADTARRLDFTEPLNKDDQLDISTQIGAKGAWVTRGSIRSSILWGVSPYSSWITLEPGVNYLRFYAEGAPVPFNLSYATRFGAI